MLDRTTTLVWPPDYSAIQRHRIQFTYDLQQQPWLVRPLLERYSLKRAEACIDFINLWGFTYDPRNAGSEKLSKLPFILFKRQEELVEFLIECLLDEENGLVEKCRDMGATWICAAVSVWLWRFWDGASIGWGSRKEQLVDRIGDPDSIFEKIRIIISNLPYELLPAGFNKQTHMTYMRIVNPANGSTITGESGDNIGRGGRKLMYFKDESAHYEHPEKIESALGDNTRVQIDISSVNGLGNVFHRRRKAGVLWYSGKKIAKGKTRVFVMDWRDHPSKDQAWYDQRRQKAEDDGLLHIFAQEVNRNYAAAIEGVVIPSLWIESAIDAHIKLKLDTSGGWVAGLDVADEGGDTNALAQRKGIVLRLVEEWGARDTGQTTIRAVEACSGLGRVELQYDSIGVGAGVKAESNRLTREKLMPKGIKLVPWNAGSSVQHPRAFVVPDDVSSPRNEDFYYNLKAQAWWSLRRRFELTHRAVTDKTFTWDVDDLISIDSKIPLLAKIQEELSQVTFSKNSRMKLLIDKSPQGTNSPNLADAIVMAFFPVIEFESPEAQYGTYGQGAR